MKGYNLLRSAARDKKMHILVGLDEPGKKRVRQALIQEILHDLRAGVDRERRQVVAELVEHLKGGKRHRLPVIFHPQYVHLGLSKC